MQLLLSLLAIMFVIAKAIQLSSKSTAKNVVDAFAAGRGPSYLAGKTALVTGGNAGIGLETCKALASAGCRVIMCSRSIKAGEEAIESEMKLPGLDGTYQISAADVARNVVVKQLDLSDLESVRRLTADVMATEPALDLVVLNAGIMSLPSLERTANGWEKQMGVNHFGHAFLMKRLLPFLGAQKTRPTRVVVLASTAHKFASEHPLQDPTYKSRRYTPWIAYGDSKLANLVYAKGLAKHLVDVGFGHVTALSVHPGVIKTALWNQSIINRIFSVFVGDRGVPEGAASTVWACLAPRGQDESLRGAYIVDCAPAAPLEMASSDALRDEVWSQTAAELARVGAE